MTVGKCVVFLVVLTSLWTFSRGDAVVCVFTESCILPCSFKHGDEVVIHWILMAGNAPVHSFYHNQDQFARQDQRFRDRTSLFKDQISRGNASLRLTGVKVQDQGRYKCYTSTITGNKESFVDLNVEAPVRKVDIQQVENRITCSSEGIYPEPVLTWSTSPPSSKSFNNTTTAHQTEQHLYSINGSLIVSDDPDLVYSCTVSAGTSRRRATLLKPVSASISGCSSEITISCTSSNTPRTGLIWRFNHSHIILNQTRTDPVSEEWRQQVKSVSDSGDLTLQDLSSNHEGTYTCELSDDEETRVKNTFLRIIVDCSTNVAEIVGGVIGAILVLGLAAGIYLCIMKKRGSKKDLWITTKQQNSEPSATTPMMEMNGSGEDKVEDTTVPPPGENEDSGHTELP